MNGQCCETWRLVHDSPLAGPRNMARDEAILHAVAVGHVPPTLRLYDWQPSTLSLGISQRASDADMSRLEHFGWGLVRRPTGGRAILHVDELTYSLCLPGSHALAQGSIIESYRRISEALGEAARILGIQTDADRAAGHGSHSPVCFETPSHYELTVEGKKLAGSAQARKDGGVLQHGALPLAGDPGRIVDALVFASEAARETARERVRARATNFTEAAGRQVTGEETVQALIHAVEHVFGVRLERGELTAREAEEVDRLEQAVYGAAEWTFRR